MQSGVGWVPAGREITNVFSTYRNIQAMRIWETGNTMARDAQKRRPNPDLLPVEVRLSLPSGLGHLEHLVSSGLRLQVPTGNTKQLPYTVVGVEHQATWTESTHVEPYLIQNGLQGWRDHLHLMVSRTIISLRASAAAEPLWEMLRTQADGLAASAGLGEDLRAITLAAASDVASEWEGALVRCRNVIDKLSRHLYRAPGSTYPHISNRGGTGPMAVDGNRYRNRLVAYMHQKGLNADDRELANSHIDWFMGFVEQVNRLGSKGKVAVSRRDVAMGLTHTYLLLSEIAERTDGQPITEIH